MSLYARGRAVASAFLLVATTSPDVLANPFSYHEHDGFYLRAGGGVGSLSLGRQTEPSGSSNTSSSPAFSGNSSSVGGASVFTELSLGGTPFKRIVVAGTLVADNLPTAGLQLASGSRFSLGSSLWFAMVAATVDVFPNPEGGFHVGGGVGWAFATAGINDPIFGTIGGGGAGFTVSGGYDLWVMDDWSLGASLRGVVARIQGEQQSQNAVGREHDTVTSVSIAVTALYH